MEKQPSNPTKKATQDARKLLESEFSEQLEGIFDILPDGHIAASPGEHLNARERIIREKIVAAIEHEKAGGVSDAEGVANYLREAAFTCLNRFAALKMLEARKLVQECVSKGEQSSGFREFCGLAPGLAELPDKGYRLYIESLFDELSTEIRVLFDRRDLASLLWPRRKAFEALLDILNRDEIASIWGEDETIGWVYQYFNSDEERKKMRNESAAPRNSRELAVRNQFFTPRYVVEFLTDNTLGRIWYEMRQGNTRLKDKCRYLVRRPKEIFLSPDEKAPEDKDEDNDLSQEEILKRPVYIEHRPKKDPRDIKILDPACGSGHFLLYSFDLLEKIYEEAWEDPESPKSEVAGNCIRVNYPTVEDLQRHIPKLIIEHNLHGIDIDHRAVQIAALSLWMRAQRSWQQKEFKANERPGIAKSNIVTAEPMPGEQDMRKEFIDGLKPRLLGQLVEEVFKKMELAGEAGALLKIEEEIQNAVAEAKRQWLEVPIPEQQSMFPGVGSPKPWQLEIQFDVKSVNDIEFWERIEEQILDALKEYAEQETITDSVSRHLFANDTAHGFAFIDLCRVRYDIVLMNPPFGEASYLTQIYLEHNYPQWSKNILCPFVDRMKALVLSEGYIGAIFDRTASIKSSYENFRVRSVIPYISAVADTGWHVLDANVETTVHVWMNSKNEKPALFFDCLNEEPENKPKLLEGSIAAVTKGQLSENCYLKPPELLLGLPNAVVGYYFPNFLISAFNDLQSLAASGLQARKGHDFVADEHVRLFWEILPQDLTMGDRYRGLYNGGGFSLFFSPLRDVAIFGEDGAIIRNHPSVYIRNAKFHLKPGLGYGKRGDILDAHIIPSGFSFTSEGLAITNISLDSALLGLGFLNSALAQFAINHYCGQHKQVGYVNLLPYPKLMEDVEKEVISNSLSIILLKRSWIQYDETTRFFRIPLFIFSRYRLSELSKIIQNKMLTAKLELNERISWNDKIFIEKSIKLSEANKRKLREFQSQRPSDSIWPDIDCNFDTDSDGFLIFVVGFMISYCFGLLFGRWDVRIALENSLATKLPDLFDPLPVCPPAMLVDPEDLPAEPNQIVSEEWLRARSVSNTLLPEGSVKKPTIPDSEYPIRISWDGILVDDPGFNGGQLHQEDIVRRTREVLSVLWKDNSQDIEQEACDILKIPDLRAYFRKTFFQDHIKRYSKSRRKAPIYWQLATPSASYSVWLYYHRFTKDTFYKLLNEYIDPKLQFEERELLSARQQYGQTPTATQRKQIATRETFVAELATFKEEVARIAPLWNPNLNDGVIINFAPLWRLVPQNKSWQRECKKIWDKLVKGAYDWAHQAMHLWPERVIPKCTKDRSLAIAHELDETLWEEDEKGKGHPKKISKETLEALIQERTSITVKAALEELLNAPAPAGATRNKRKRKA